LDTIVLLVIDVDWHPTLSRFTCNRRTKVLGYRLQHEGVVLLISVEEVIIGFDWWIQYPGVVFAELANRNIPEFGRGRDLDRLNTVLWVDRKL
jgi:hypothetical protein